MRPVWRAKQPRPGTEVLVKKPDTYYLPETNIFDIQVEEFNKADTIHIPSCEIKKNKLEAIIVPLTSHEIVHDKFDLFAKIMIQTTPSVKHLYLILFINNSTYTDPEAEAIRQKEKKKKDDQENKEKELLKEEEKGVFGNPQKVAEKYKEVPEEEETIRYSEVYPKFLESVKQLKRIFKRVIIVNVDIPETADIYSVSYTGQVVPKYGLVSGPNLLFLNAMNYCRRFNTVLLLETDCILKENWIGACESYVNNCGTFLISGSTYDGSMHIEMNFKNPASFLHINGVAFYNTGSTVFQTVIDELNDYLPYYAKMVSPVNAYDYVMSYMIFHKLNEDTNFKFWKYVYRNIVKNTLILNYSLAVDKKKSVKDIYRLFPSCVVLHKKLF